RLEVTFFWPFYGGYNVFALDTKNYGWSMVCGNDRSYLWILARTRKLPEELLKQLLDKAKSLGFDVSKLIFVPQDREDG
ncbi:MAG: lipocalin family protein, partial [Planctomycetes bacterium]|nr:lipocalin family protein [Planctomycetota bacterium]